MYNEKHIQTINTSEKPHPTETLKPYPDPPITTFPPQDVDIIDPEPASEKPVKKEDSTTDEPHSVYTTNQKRAIILAASIASFFSPLSANIYLPALNTLATDLHVSNTLITLTVTSYLVRHTSHFFGMARKIECALYNLF
jgi:hypothetical protein